MNLHGVSQPWEGRGQEFMPPSGVTRGCTCSTVARIYKVPPNPGKGRATKVIPPSGVTRGCMVAARIYMVPPASMSSHPFSKRDKVIPPSSVTKGRSTVS